MKLEANHISFRYQSGSRQILNNVSFSLESHERVALSAPSGFGKTTFCRILAGYEKPDEGTILADGRDLSSYKGYCPVQLIWQHPEEAVNPKLKMREVILEGNHIEQRILDGLGIKQEWMSRYPAELSGGEIQRFCIARALGEKTKILIADEITAMLDLVTQSQIWSFLLEEVKYRGIGLLVVSHSEALSERICTGKIQAGKVWNKVERK